MRVCVCVCEPQRPRQVCPFNQGWLKTDGSDLNVTLAVGRAVRQLQEGMAETGQEGSEAQIKKPADLGQQDGDLERTG